MGSIVVLSRTQRIIVESPSSVKVVNAGAVGPAGLSFATSASGEQATESLTWIMNHNLHFYPAALRFFSEDGLDELEPESVTYATLDRIIATWPEVVAGTWMVS